MYTIVAVSLLTKAFAIYFLCELDVARANYCSLLVAHIETTVGVIHVVEWHGGHGAAVL